MNLRVRSTARIATVVMLAAQACLMEVPDPTRRCGDGDQTWGETCDDGNTDDCVGSCSADCTTVVTGCGDGVVCGHETCDDAGESATCNADCTKAHCGDGTINVSAGETCDDGSTADGDGCSSQCAVEGHFECEGEPSRCHSACATGDWSCASQGPSVGVLCTAAGVAANDAHQSALCFAPARVGAPATSRSSRYVLETHLMQVTGR